MQALNSALCAIKLNNVAITDILRRCVVTRSFLTHSLMMMDGPPDSTGGPRRLQTAKNSGQPLRHIRYQNQLAGKLLPPGVIDVQVVGTGHAGAPRCVVVNMDHFRYLFNCGEGCQRIASEHKMRISRIQEVFFTHRSWDNIGGLLGMCLSLEATKVPQLGIHGPPDIEQLVTMSRGFAELHTLRIEKREVSTGFYRDSAMEVEYVPILPSTAASQPRPRTDIEQPDEKKRKLSTDIDHQMSVAYICRPIERQRKVSLEKCVAAGISKGPMVGRLKNGETVTLEDGRMVEPEEILDPAEPNPPFVVLECPSVDYLDGLTSSVQLQQLQRDPDAAPCVVVHLSAGQVMADQRYQRWMSGFSEGTQHFVVNEHGSPLAFEGLYRIQAKLNMIHNDIFPLLPHQLGTQHPAKEDPCAPNVTQGETNMKYIIRGKGALGYTREQCIQLDNEAYRAEEEDKTDVKAALNSAKAALQNMHFEGSAYPEILFLGTGSSMPSKVRNVSAIWINISETKSILLDCGENTYGQLERHYGADTPAMMRRLEAIFVSHLHADHHLGIFTFAEMRKKLLSPEEYRPLAVVAPARLLYWYGQMDDLVLPVLHLVRVIAIERYLKPREPQEQPENNSSVTQSMLDDDLDLDMEKIVSVRVRHRQFPHGIVLKHKSGWSLVYSGDTMPCEELVEAGVDCDVLIHEATMEDDLGQEAYAKKHSTTSQAIDIGLKMRAKFILLTHFSQRYPKIPLFNENFSSKVGIAFDNMRVKLRELPALPLMVQALKEMFADEYADLEDKKSTRKRAPKIDGAHQPGWNTHHKQSKGQKSPPAHHPAKQHSGQSSNKDAYRNWQTS